MNNMKNVYITLYLLLATTYVLHAAANSASADFLLVKNPQTLTLFNHFEQLLEKKQKTLFPPFCPFLILEDNIFLGDGLTSVIKVEWQKRVFFIKKNKDKTIAGVEQGADYELLPGCKIIGDTLLFAGPGKFFLYARKKLRQEEKQSVQQGERLIRLFAYKKFYYMQRTAPPAAYGWCKKKSARYLEKAPSLKTKKSLELAPRQKEKIRALLANVNRTYEQYFKFFNRTKKKYFAAPLWEEREGPFRFYFDNSGEHFNLESSTAVLVNMINLSLSGSGFSAFYDNKESTVFIRKSAELPEKQGSPPGSDK